MDRFQWKEPVCATAHEREHPSGLESNGEAVDTPRINLRGEHARREGFTLEGDREAGDADQTGKRNLQLAQHPKSGWQATCQRQSGRHRKLRMQWMVKGWFGWIDCFRIAARCKGTNPRWSALRMGDPPSFPRWDWWMSHSIHSLLRHLRRIKIRPTSQPIKY